MAEFFFTPATVSDPKNHPRRIYFSCHPDDIVYFDTIAEQIRTIEADCVIARAFADGDETLRLKGLEDFHLTVIPITENWFSEGAHTREFTHLTTIHKAILPILFNSSLEERFNQTSNNLQFLRFNDPDYSEKLRRTLQDILFDNKLLDKVRSVFTHKMFISYCREDTDQVVRLIRSIHSVKGGKRIAIWYDKYLPFGKNFEDSIFSELDNSDFFAVTLTQSLLNRDNYVKQYEYPYAQSAGKKIIFFELDPVEKNKMLTQMQHSDEYDYISLNNNAFSSLMLRLLKEKPGRFAQLSPSETDYLLALAYQNGLFVEFDHQYAAQRFKTAANANNVDAAHSLANMLYHGIGISRDVKKAIKWYEKEVHIAKQSFKKMVDQLCSMFKIINNQIIQIITNNDTRNDLQIVFEQISIITHDLISRCCNNARILRDEGRFNDAERLYRTALHALDLIDRVANELALGDKYRSNVENEMNTMLLISKRTDIDNCRSAWLSCLKKYNDEPESYENIHGLLHSGHNYGVMLLSKRHFDKARNVMLQALDTVTSATDSTIGDERTIWALELKLYRDVGRTYILEEPNSEEQRNSNANEALRRFDYINSRLDNPPFNLDENPYLYTLKPWILMYTGDAYDYISDNTNAYDSYWQALIKMMEAEEILGDKAMSADFPIIMLEFYSLCMQNLAQYSVTKHSAMLCTIAEQIITRYGESEFEAEHTPLAKSYLKMLSDAVESLRTMHG